MFRMSSPSARVLTPLAIILALTGAVAAAPAASQPTWADAASATIHPGVQTVSGGQCTSNFVFTDRRGGVYLGQAAHCSGTGAQTDTNGCTTGSLDLGLPVEVDGASHPGTLVYSSWITMQDVGETDPNACAHNDFALVKLHPDDVGLVNPSIPVLGGPVALVDEVSSFSTVNSFGNSGLRFGLEALSPKTGVSLGQDSGGWNHTVYTMTPGIPGDSGSGFVDDQGNAFGVLSTLALFPMAASNGVSDLALALDYARTHAGLDVTLAAGTEPFTGFGLPSPAGAPVPTELSRSAPSAGLPVGNLL